ncbi:hypothetical protein HF521_017913 [Silurus meridionalis]|uniref:Retinol dehydrogenase 11 n=1 Tax=Silurus meridionalis TaxID=175797 RepID=A0A8T0BTS8_SILME|nr:hypothetical protein HF521_017913 [Silurus meridionalis]
MRKWIAGGMCKSRARLDGKTVMITGANTGIGKETAKDLARRARDSAGHRKVIIWHMNLASLYSIHEFAKEFLATEERLDILINNLGHSLLTNLLLGILKISAPSRVVNVSSIAHAGGKIHIDDLFFDKRPYNSLESYKQSKLANVLFSRELARRMKGTGLTSYSLHPGVINTDLIRHVKSKFPPLSSVLTFFSILLMKTPWQGAQTSIHCAVTEGLEKKFGCYFR